MQIDLIVYIFDLVGTATFAVTGALAAIRKRMDVFGVFVLAVITALGGGTIRDLLLDNMPPFYFRDPMYLVVAVGTALVVFLAPKIFYRLGTPIVIFDAIGLGVFTVIGAEKAMAADLEFVPVILLGMLTGIGGGMIRDVLRREIPFVLQKEIYASAALFGAVVFYVLIGPAGAPLWAALLAGMLSTVVVRLLSVKYSLGLPKKDGASGEGR